MKYFPSFCVDGFFEDPDQIRKIALEQDFNNIGACQGRRTDLLQNICPQIHDNFCKRFFSFFFDLEKNEVDWAVKTYFHLHKKTDNKNFSNLTDESHILAHKYEDFEPSYEASIPTSVHTDDCLISGVVYLNPIAEDNAGSAIYRVVENADPVYITNSIKKETVVMSANFKQVYNRIVGFDGACYHGRTGDNTLSERLTLVYFVLGINANIPPPLIRYKTEKYNK